MLNVVCVRTGQKYSPDYVYKLKNMVERNLKQEHKFYCITENPSQVHGIETIPAPIQVADSWCKIGLFTSQLQKVKKGDKMLFLDLDVVITGSLDDLIAGKLINKKDEQGDKIPCRDFWIVKDWHDPYNSSVMYWEHGQQGRIYVAFKGIPDMERLRGDQNLIAEVATDAKTFKQGAVLSYKFDNVKAKPEKAKVVLFHGKPKMSDLPDVAWIQKEWK